MFLKQTGRLLLKTTLALQLLKLEGSSPTVSVPVCVFLLILKMFGSRFQFSLDAKYIYCVIVLGSSPVHT